MDSILSIQLDEFREQFNSATRQVVKLKMSGINLQAKVFSLQPWQFKGLDQLDEQKALMAQIKELKSKVDQINRSIANLGVKNVDNSESVLIDNLNKQGGQINSTLKEINQDLESTKNDLIAKSPWAAIAVFFDDLGQVLEEIFIQSINYATKAINLLPEQQRKDVKRFFGGLQKFLPKGED